MDGEEMKEHRRVLTRAWIVPVGAVVLIAGHVMLPYLLSRAGLTTAVVSGVVVLVVFKHLGLFGCAVRPVAASPPAIDTQQRQFRSSEPGPEVSVWQPSPVREKRSVQGPPVVTSAEETSPQSLLVRRSLQPERGLQPWTRPSSWWTQTCMLCLCRSALLRSRVTKQGSAEAATDVQPGPSD